MASFLCLLFSQIFLWISSVLVLTAVLLRSLAGLIPVAGASLAYVAAVCHGLALRFIWTGRQLADHGFRAPMGGSAYGSGLLAAVFELAKAQLLLSFAEIRFVLTLCFIAPFSYCRNIVVQVNETFAHALIALYGHLVVEPYGCVKETIAFYGNIVIQLYGSVKETIAHAFTAFYGYLKRAVCAVLRLFDHVFAYAKGVTYDVLRTIVDYLRVAIYGTVERFIISVDNFFGAIHDYFHPPTSAARGATSAVCIAASALSSATSAAMSSATSAVVSGATSALSGATSALNGAASALSSATSAAMSSATSAAVSGATSALNGATSALSSATSAAVSATSAAMSSTTSASMSATSAAMSATLAAMSSSTSAAVSSAMSAALSGATSAVASSPDTAPAPPVAPQAFKWNPRAQPYIPSYFSPLAEPYTPSYISG